jgi:hypothetical protein
MRTATRHLTLLIVGLALVAGACGNLNDDPGDGGTTPPTSPAIDGIDHPTGADEVILRVWTTGGFAPVEWLVASFPEFSLMGDGTLVVAGAQIEIYPPPALPAMNQRHITEEGIQAILEAAEAAGLFELGGTYGNNCVADAATTYITLAAGGETHDISAYALGMDDTGNCADDETKQIRKDLYAFTQQLFDLSWLPEGSVGPEEPYDFQALRIYATPARMGDADPGLEPAYALWPLDVPLSKFGEPVEVPSETRCGVVTGADLDELMTSLQNSNTLTFWRSDGQTYHLILRPLLPDETGCEMPTFSQAY